jgi:hypothetical protein
MKLQFTYTLIMKTLADFINIVICINLIIMESLYGTYLRETTGNIEFS